MSIRPRAPIGSLLKQAQPVKRKKLDLGRKPRERDEAHLANIRLCACIDCGRDPGGEASHVRMTREGKLIAGIGNKPDDCWTLPSCHDCHMEQHRIGELSYYADLGIDPIKLASSLYAAPDLDRMRSIISEVREITVAESGDGSD